ncbi:MAG: peptidylprolyl isomerase [Pseudohongiella sp.]|nr:peptidylprolyl isomerase [Pseudohongiella sp.]
MNVRQVLISQIRRYGAVLALLVATGATSAHANPLVRVTTTYGDFTLELLQDSAPDTVSNFLGYVDRGDFSRVVVHRSVTDFVIQGGQFRWLGDCVSLIVGNCGPAFVPVGPTVVNEPGVSNLRGTVAMAKMDGFVNSATNQWFINLADNSANLDAQNGGFTVFARVLGNGISVADAINDLPLTFVSDSVTDMPVRDYGATATGPVEKNLVLMNVYRVQRFSESMHVFDYGTGLLNTYVNGGETLGNVGLVMQIVEDGAQIVFQVDPRSIIPLAITPAGMASYSESDQRLRIPQVELNQNGQVSQVSNVVMRLVDAVNLRFVIESYE